MTEEQVRVEEFELSGDKVVAKIKELVHEGNIRRISLQTKEGQTLIEVPLTVGVAGVIAGDVLAGVGRHWRDCCYGSDLKIVVERVE